MRVRIAVSLAALALLAACSSGTDPVPPSRYDGSWVAIRANNAPLPYTWTNGFTYRVDSLRLSVLFSASGASIAEYGTRTALGTTSPSNNVRFVSIDTSAGRIRVFVPVGESSPFEFTAQRTADSLVIADYHQARWVLMKRP